MESNLGSWNIYSAALLQTTEVKSLWARFLD